MDVEWQAQLLRSLAHQLRVGHYNQFIGAWKLGQHHCQLWSYASGFAGCQRNSLAVQYKPYLMSTKASSRILRNQASSSSWYLR